MTWLDDITDQLWANKLAKGFNTTDVPLEFCLLTAEVGEAIDAWRRDPDSLPGELADVFLFLLSVARMNGVDLEQAVVDKMAVNVARQYVRNAVTGQPVKADAGRPMRRSQLSSDDTNCFSYNEDPDTNVCSCGHNTDDHEGELGGCWLCVFQRAQLAGALRGPGAAVDHG